MPERRAMVLTLMLAACACAMIGAADAAVVTERISVTEYGGMPNGASWGVSMSSDARYVSFYSGAGNLVSGDDNSSHDIFVRDRLFGTIELISRSSVGELGNNHSLYPDISEDGRYVAFCSMADNLVADDENGFMDVFVRDLDTDLTLLVSRSPTGPANEKSPWCSISANGQYVAFQSEATNLIEGETYGWPGVYLADLSTPTVSVTAVSISYEGDSPNGSSVTPYVSADGSYVVFRSLASDLVSGDTNGVSDVFLRDVVTPTTVRVSVADLTGAEGNGATTGQPAVTPDGRYVVFASYADNLVAGDTNGTCDVFLRDLTLGRTELISVSSAGIQGNGNSGGEPLMLRVSADGRYVVFSSLASNLVDNDTNGWWDVFVRDRTAETTTRVSVSTTGEEANRNSGLYSLDVTPDGATVAFDSGADNLVMIDTNGGPDVFVRGEPLAPAAPILVIDGDAEYTTSLDVVLTVDPGDYSEVRFKNEDSGWSDWESALTSKEWALSSGDGVKRVYVQGREGVDLSAENYDEITLDSSAPSGATVTINGGDAETISRWVTLTLTATGATEMRFRNETSAWSDWEPFATSKLWKLSYDRGTKTVGFQCRDTAGNTTPEVTDTIDTIIFTDVPEDYWAFEEIMACVDAEVVAGYPEGDYKPELAVTRDQMAVYIARSLAGGDDNVPLGPVAPSFSDVATDHWAYDYIEYSVDQDVVQGYPEGDYKPSLEVDRGQMAVYIARAIATPTGEAGLVGYVPPTEPTFPDVLTDFWAYKYVEYVSEQDVVQGYPYPDPENPGETITLYEPLWTVTRDQMAVYVGRAFGLLE